MSTREEIKKVILFMTNAFPNYHPSLDGELTAVDVYHALLGDMPNDTLGIAVAAACAERGREFAPSAGEIREAAAKIHALASGMPEAGEAWGALQEYWKGIDREPKGLLTHPLVEKTIHAMGGLRSLGMSDNVVADRAHFMQLFNQFQKKALDEAAELPIVTRYIEAHRAIGAQTHQLVEKLSNPQLTKGR